MFHQLVEPKLPRYLHDGSKILQLPGHDLWLTFIKNVHLVPALLDEQRLEESLATILAVYPHSCGRLVSNASGWAIRLAGCPVPLIRASVDSRCPLQDGPVVQQDLAAFLPSSQGSVVNEDRSLLLVKITSFRNSTTFGIAWHHTLGDAFTLFRFMSLWSQTYQGLNAIYPEPTFGNATFPSFGDNIRDEFLPLMPHLTETYAASEHARKYAEQGEDIVCINWVLDATNLTLGSLNLSLQDRVTAYIVALLNRLGASIRRVTNVVNYRRSLSPSAVNLAGNAIFVIPSEPIEPDGDIDHIARTIRQSLLKARQAAFVQRYMYAASSLMESAANANRSMFFGGDPRTLSVNSNLSFDWKSANFGHRSSQFFTSGFSRFYLRTFTPNCSTVSQGTVEISLGVPSNLDNQVREALARDFGTTSL